MAVWSREGQGLSSANRSRSFPTRKSPQGRTRGCRAFSGTITVVYRGCSDLTLLVVTGPGRGRLVEVNSDGFFPPRFHADSDFLSWYERWLDFVLADIVI